MRAEQKLALLAALTGDVAAAATLLGRCAAFCAGDAGSRELASSDRLTALPRFVVRLGGGGSTCR